MIEMEIAQKTTDADAALGVAHEALMQAQAAVTEPQSAVDALVLAHTALDAADDAVEAIAGLVGGPTASALDITVAPAVQAAGVKRKHSGKRGRE